MTTELKQAYADWHGNRAYIDGKGNYHLKRDGRTRGPIAPWNSLVRRTFTGVSQFDQAATHAFDVSSVNIDDLRAIVDRARDRFVQADEDIRHKQEAVLAAEQNKRVLYIRYAELSDQLYVLEHQEEKP